MKKEYLKPSAEYISLETESITDDLDIGDRESGYDELPEGWE